MVGTLVGLAVIAFVGLAVGGLTGLAVGFLVGLAVGGLTGLAVGGLTGLAVGFLVGLTVGTLVGLAVGGLTGFALGFFVGLAVGFLVGGLVRACVAWVGLGTGGSWVGLIVGFLVGLGAGILVGLAVRALVGLAVWTIVAFLGGGGTGWHLAAATVWLSPVLRLVVAVVVVVVVVVVPPPVNGPSFNRPCDVVARSSTIIAAATAVALPYRIIVKMVVVEVDPNSVCLPSPRTKTLRKLNQFERPGARVLENCEMDPPNEPCIGGQCRKSSRGGPSRGFETQRLVSNMWHLAIGPSAQSLTFIN